MPARNAVSDRIIYHLRWNSSVFSPTSIETKLEGLLQLHRKLNHLHNLFQLNSSKEHAWSRSGEVSDDHNNDYDNYMKKAVIWTYEVEFPFITLLMLQTLSVIAIL